MAKLGNAIERASWAGRLADALRIEDELVLQELRAALTTAQKAIRHRPGPSSRPLREAEARMVNLLLRSEEERARWVTELDPEDLAETEVAPIVDTIFRLVREGGQVDHPTVLSALSDDAERDLLTRIAFRDEPETGPTVEDCLWACKRERLRRRGREVASEIDRLEKADGSPEDSSLDERLAELQRLARQRDALQ